MIMNPYARGKSSGAFEQMKKVEADYGGVTTQLAANALKNVTRANANRFGVLVDDPCDDTSGWTVTGAVTADGKFTIPASANILKAASTPKTVPLVVTMEVFKTGRTPGGIYLLDASNVILCAVAIDNVEENHAGTYGNVSSINENKTAFTPGTGFRMYLVYDPTDSVVRGYIQDDGTHGATYIGASAVSGIPTQIKILRGSSGTGTLRIDNIIAAPLYAVAVGDSRTAGHGSGGYDPWPDYYAGDDNPLRAWPYSLYKDTGVYVVNDGAGSTNSAANLARIGNAISMRPKIIIIGASNMGETVDTIKINYVAMIAAILAAGIVPVLTEIPPYTGEDYQDDIAEINTWINTYCVQNGIALIHNYTPMADGIDLAAKYDVGDHIHWSTLGAQKMAELTADVIS